MIIKSLLESSTYTPISTSETNHAADFENRKVVYQANKRRFKTERESTNLSGFFMVQISILHNKIHILIFDNCATSRAQSSLFISQTEQKQASSIKNECLSIYLWKK